MYRKQYCGFRVKLISSQLGDVVGTVCNVTESKIELTNAIMNGMGSPIPFVAVESEFIQDLRILAADNGDSADSMTPKKEPNPATNSAGRAGRREMLRNIPNAHSAYVCPDSPPLIYRSTDATDNSPRSKGPFGLKSLDTALTASSPNDKRHAYKTPKQHRQERKPNRRSQSFSEAAASSEVSGTESDSFQRAAQHGAHRAAHQQPGRSFGRSHPRVCSSSNRQTAKVDWDQIRVEDFIDQEFDFEKNLALFNKTAFYEMVDMQNGVSSKPTEVKPSAASPKPLDEGPDGVGSPLMSSFRHTERYPPVSKKDYYDDCTMTTNTATLSSARQRHEHSIPYYHPSSQAPTATNDTSVGSGYGGPCISYAVHNPAATTHRFLYSTSGLRVPALQADDHARMLHFLATGKDMAEQAAATPVFHGLTWGRILETAGRAFVDYTLEHLRPPNATSQRSSRRPPPRILVIPGEDDLAGAFALTTARLLASRGSSVLLVCPHNTAADAPSVHKDSVYLEELALCLDHAPRSNPYGCTEDQTQLDEDPSSDNDDDCDSDEDMVTGMREALAASKRDQLGPLSDGESELASCFTLDHLSPQPVDLADSNPLYRIWVSRMPGLKLVRRSSALSRLPSNIRIDLVILGHCPVYSVHSGISSRCTQWIRTHRAVSRVAHLMPFCRSSPGTHTLQTNALVNWIVDLGLPVLGPASNTSAESSLVPPSMTHALIDVGMSRHVLLRLTSDLRFLPPHGLFDSGSVVGLKPSASTPAPLV